MDNAMIIPPNQLRWVRHGNQCEMSVLSGDPDKAGSLYAIRYRTLVACDVAAHWHPEDEHVTVIGGEVSLGFGKTFSADALRSLAAGSYALIPREQPHFSRYAAGTSLQVHGVGPLVTNYIEEI